MKSAKLLHTKVDRETKANFWYLFGGSRGAWNRIRIMTYLKNNAANKNQIAKEMEVDYKAIKHHLRILEKYNLVNKTDNVYAAIYYVAPTFEINEEIFWEIVNKIHTEKQSQKLFNDL